MTIRVRWRVKSQLRQGPPPPSWLRSLQPLANPDRATLPTPSLGKNSGREVPLTRNSRGERSGAVTWYPLSARGGLYKQASSSLLQDNDGFSISVYRWWEENMWRSPTPLQRDINAAFAQSVRTSQWCICLNNSPALSLSHWFTCDGWSRHSIYLCLCGLSRLIQTKFV